MPNKKELNKRVENESKSGIPIRNDNLVCKNCVHRYDDSKVFGNTSKCAKYKKSKPNSILLGNACVFKETK